MVTVSMVLGGAGGDAGAEPVRIVALVPGGEGEHGALRVGRGGRGAGAGDGDVVAGEGRHGVLLAIDAGGDDAVLEDRNGCAGRQGRLEIEEVRLTGRGVVLRAAGD